MQKSSLLELFSVEDREKISQDQNKILIFDAHNLAYRSVFSAIFMNPQDNENFYFFRHLFMNSLLNTIVKFNPSKVILAFDTKGSWRYEVYPEYKSTRKKYRDKAVVDFDKFFPIFEEFKNDIKETFKTFYVIEHPKAEADDIIAVFCKEKFKTNKNIIVSTDKDMHQLLIEKNNQQFDPINNKIINCINPKRELDLKIITGDKGDAIPSIRPRTGIATAEAILQKGINDFLEEKGNEEFKQNYLRNRVLIDFNFIPKNLSDGIINTYNTYNIGQIESSKLMNFFSKNRLMKIMENWSAFSTLIKSLK